jgi:hypothetical protein
MFESRLTVRRNPLSEGAREPLQEHACAVVDELALGGEELVGAATMDFRLLHRRYVEEDQGLTQVMVRPETANRAR